ncbi:hypothetical protein E2A64_16660 [Pseudohoeflea suaedae]|uniref:OpgC domain-containing protein n=1 Tax=Pseudohoeflea suaedae TaxID=877384 RepID=A0A4R5PHK4_9HYPH|nr:OpgC domain-containing protein [Pseudohoeflea suaedae]TDH34302.1 hypothetical protein E2A64_16660 [Pseudohoeflea suaedae]
MYQYFRRDDAGKAPHRSSGQSGVPASTRDTRLDVLRTICLMMIFINHVPGNPLEIVTSKNYGLSDAAEAFVLISGIAAGFAYGRKFGAGEKLLTTLRAWRRAGVLYVAQIMTTIASIAIFALFALGWSDPRLFDTINMGRVLEDPARGILGIVTLGHQLGYNNILSMYAGILLMLPFFLLISRWRLWAMVLVSVAIWLGAGLWSIGPRTYPGEGFWFLSPLSWQVIFILGIACNLHIARGGTIPRNKWLILAAIAYLVGSCVWVWVPLWGWERVLHLPRILSGFDKTFLSLPRVLHIFAIAYLIAVLPWLSAIFRLRSNNPLAVIGRHGLPIFIFGTLMAITAQAFIKVTFVGPVTSAMIVIAGLLLHIVYAYYLEWLGRLKRQASNGRRAAAGPALPGQVAAPKDIAAKAPNAGASPRGIAS